MNVSDSTAERRGHVSSHQKITRKRRSAAGNISDRIYNEIYKSIVVEKWPAGSFLPTEHKLADMFSVSRSVVREALFRLRIDGLIESRQGSGSRVIAAPNRVVLDFAEPGSIADLQRCFEFRMGVEGEAAYMAATHCSTSRLAEIEQVLNLMADGAKTSETQGTEEDIAFHIAVAKATENSYYLETIRSTSRALVVGIGVARALSPLPPEDRLRKAFNEHQLVFDAIKKGDADRARLTMREHIDGARKRVFVGISVP